MVAGAEMGSSIFSRSGNRFQNNVSEFYRVVIEDINNGLFNIKLGNQEVEKELHRIICDCVNKRFKNMITLASNLEKLLNYATQLERTKIQNELELLI
jgi:hypothetical protein